MILWLKIWLNVVCDLAWTCGFTELCQGGSAWTWQRCSRCVCVVAQWPQRGIQRSSSEKVTDWTGFKPVLLAEDDQKPLCRLKEVALWADRKLFSQSKESLWFREMWNLFERSFFKKTCNMETYTTIHKIDSQWEFAVWGTQTGGSVTN